MHRIRFEYVRKAAQVEWWVCLLETSKGGSDYVGSEVSNTLLLEVHCHTFESILSDTLLLSLHSHTFEIILCTISLLELHRYTFRLFERGYYYTVSFLYHSCYGYTAVTFRPTRDHLLLYRLWHCKAQGRALVMS